MIFTFSDLPAFCGVPPPILIECSDCVNILPSEDNVPPLNESSKSLAS